MRNFDFRSERSKRNCSPAPTIKPRPQGTSGYVAITWYKWALYVPASDGYLDKFYLNTFNDLMARVKTCPVKTGCYGSLIRTTRFTYPESSSAKKAVANLEGFHFQDIYFDDQTAIPHKYLIDVDTFHGNVSVIDGHTKSSLMDQARKGISPANQASFDVLHQRVKRTVTRLEKAKADGLLPSALQHWQKQARIFSAIEQLMEKAETPHIRRAWEQLAQYSFSNISTQQPITVAIAYDRHPVILPDQVPLDIEQTVYYCLGVHLSDPVPSSKFWQLYKKAYPIHYDPWKG